MRTEAYLLLLLNSLALALRRGPHHPHGQTPVDQKHHHYKPSGSVSLMEDPELLHDAKHIEEDTKLTPEDLARMTPEELEFHYFSAHDFDRNSKLDGLELLKAVYHMTEHEAAESEHNDIEPEADSLVAYIELVDRTLETDDTDGDGYISYPEYRAARLRSPSHHIPNVQMAP